MAEVQGTLDPPQPFQIHPEPFQPQHQSTTPDDSENAMPPPLATAAVRRERRVSSTPSAGSASPDFNAPSVWTTPDWASHPVIESYYGHARRARENSFYEVMQSPTNTLATRTLAESCNSYGRHDSDADDGDDSHGEDGVHNHERRRSSGSHKLGSGSFSFTTETSDEVVGASPSFSTSSNDSGYELHPRVHASTISTIATVAGGRADHHPHRKSPVATPRRTAHGGYAHWNKKRLPTDLVPVPPQSNRMKKPTLDAAHTVDQGQASVELYSVGNPQGGHAGSPTSSTGSGNNPDSPTRDRPAQRLRTKLQDCRLQIDDRIAIEVALARDAHACLKRSMQAAANPKRDSLMWSLLCGANTSSPGYARNGSSGVSFDGIELLHERLAVALHHRALNQLHRHRRHVHGILQIVTSHNPDLALTEKQLDSFESADAMLANDVKYETLSRQVSALATARKKRLDARRHATIQNGRDCFESPRIKSSMLAKLLEAVSWYRLVQANARDETASTSVGLAVESQSTGAVLGSDAAAPAHEASLSSGSSGSSSRSSLSASRSLQELQVERILSVLAGEEFYSDYSELMCQPDWWDIAQAHFENLVFSSRESRVAQWVLRVSKDVAAVSLEPLDEETSFRLDEKKGHRATKAAPLDVPAEWTRDPQPEQILEFVDRVTRRIRKEFEVPTEVTKSLYAFVQRMVFPRLVLLCYNQKTLMDCQRKDKLWRKQCVDLSGLPLENLNVSAELAAKIRSKLPSRHVPGGRKAYLIRAIDAFNGMTSVVPCDLLDELMYGVVILHHEAALVLGTTQFSVETFFPLLTYVLLHCQLPTIHAQLHLLENYAITSTNANGEESYYVYCVHAAIEYVCNSSGLSATPAPLPTPVKQGDELENTPAVEPVDAPAVAAV